jgi:hypothetical protein
MLSFGDQGHQSPVSTEPPSESRDAQTGARAQEGQSKAEPDNVLFS